MGKKSSICLGRLLLQIALGLLLAIGGIYALQDKGSDIAIAITETFKGDVGNIVRIVFAVVELLAGIFLILELFMGDVFGKLDKILMIIIMIVWIVGIVLLDFLNGKFLKPDVLPWLYQFAGHLLVLGAMVYLND